MSKKIQLFCLPYAGGTTEIFHEFSSYFNKNIEVIALEYAGHGSRRKEAYYENFQLMVEDMAELMNQQMKLECEIVLFGYSMGSIVAYEIYAQGLLKKKPQNLFFASHEAPDVEWESKQYYKKSEEDFFHLLQNLGGFERCNLDMLQNRFFQKLHFEPVREDYRLLGQYKMSKKVKLDVPTVIFYSPVDIKRDNIQKWKDFLCEKSEFIEIGENHFFIRDYTKDMACIFLRYLV